VQLVVGLRTLLRQTFFELPVGIEKFLKLFLGHLPEERQHLVGLRRLLLYCHRPRSPRHP
jgi:hypothetical protein